MKCHKIWNLVSLVTLEKLIPNKISHTKKRSFKFNDHIRLEVPDKTPQLFLEFRVVGYRGSEVSRSSNERATLASAHDKLNPFESYIKLWLLGVVFVPTNVSKSDMVFF